MAFDWNQWVFRQIGVDAPTEADRQRCARVIEEKGAAFAVYHMREYFATNGTKQVRGAED